MFDDLAKILNTADSFLIASHINPEGDSVGSVFAMEYLLHKLGKKTTVVCQDQIPGDCKFLNVSWVLYDQIKEPPQFQWAVVLDSPSIERIGSVSKLITEGSKIINIDHHISNKYFGTCNIVAPDASSCGEMLYSIFKHLGISITKEVASFLYTAISTDTGSFRYQNTTEYTHSVISDLIHSGIDINYLNEQLFSNISPQKIKLLERFLHNVHFSQDKTIAWSFLTNNDFLSVNAKPEDSEGFVNILRDVKGVNIAFLACENNDSPRIKISLRSKGDSDVNKVAKIFGGGGHAKASGCTIEDTLNGAVEQLLSKAQEHVASARG